MDGIGKMVESKSRTFLAFCFSFIFGVGVWSWSVEARWGIFLYGILFLIILCLVWYWREKTRRFILLCLLFFCLGSLRFLWSMPDCTNAKNVCFFNGERKKIVGWIGAEPTREISQTKYILKSALGKVLLVMPIEPAFDYGDELMISCSLQAPKDQLDSVFSYRQYLAKDDIYTICNNPKILEIKKDVQGNIFMRKILSWKNIVQNQVGELWTEPEATLMGGILYGARAGFSDELKNNFNRAGITHIVAVSGYNVTIIAQWLLVFFIGIGLWRRQAFWGVVTMIILFVIFTGASSSVVRAGIMGILVLVAGQLGKMSRIGNVLVLTAGAMVLLNPFILVWDTGFQLSFLATLGLVYVSPVLKQIFESRVGVNNETPPLSLPLKEGETAKLDMFKIIFCNEVLISTLSAIIATLPFMLFTFGRISVVAPIANVLVLWIIPWLMLLGFVAIVVSFIFYPLGQVIAWVTGLGLKYVIILAEWFGEKDWSAWEFSLPWWGMIILYLLMVYLINSKKVQMADN